MQNLFLVCLSQQLQHAIRKLGQQQTWSVYTKTDEKKHPQPSSPMELAQSQQNLEQVISNTLKTVPVKPITYCSKLVCAQ